MSDTRIKEGQEIVSGLLVDGVDQWASSSTHDGDDWSYIDAVKTQRDFANTIIGRLTDDAGDTALLIVTVLVRAACDTFESLISGWDDEMLADVPAIVSGLARAEAWLKEGENE
jgi:hypothetical protein